jgi:hypothetical protein
LQANGISGFGGLNFFCLVILSEVSIQFVLAISRQNSCALCFLKAKMQKFAPKKQNKKLKNADSSTSTSR